MEAIRKIVKVQDHKVTVELPIDFTANEVEVIVLPIENNNKFKLNEAPTRYEVMQKMKGIFKDSTYIVKEDDIYTQ